MEVTDLVQEGVEVGRQDHAGLAGAQVAAVLEPAAAKVPARSGAGCQVVPQLRLLVRAQACCRCCILSTHTHTHNLDHSCRLVLLQDQKLDADSLATLDYSVKDRNSP